ncbi:MAG: hypothetical protein AAFQ07_16370, partial [Chloroflexota bacterium]
MPPHLVPADGFTAFHDISIDTTTRQFVTIRPLDDDISISGIRVRNIITQTNVTTSSQLVLVELEPTAKPLVALPPETSMSTEVPLVVEARTLPLLTIPHEDDFEGAGQIWSPDTTLWMVTEEGQTGQGWFVDATLNNTDVRLEHQALLDFRGVNRPAITFGLRADARPQSTLYVDVRVEDTETWQTVFTSSSNSQAWQEERILLDDFAGQILQVRFRMETGAGNSSGMGYWVDDFTALNLDTYIAVLQRTEMATTVEPSATIGVIVALENTAMPTTQIVQPANTAQPTTSEVTTTPQIVGTEITVEPTATTLILESTATNTQIPTATATLEPTTTATLEPTATNTQIPTATATLEPTATNTQIPTATATLEPTATNTQI